MDKINIDIKQIRENQRLTQTEFSKILGVSRSTIVKIEGGEVKLSKKMTLKLEEAFPKELNLPFDNSGFIGGDTDSEILITIISTNLGTIDHVKELLKKMSLNTDYTYSDPVFLKRFLSTSKRLNFEENELIFEGDSIKYNYRFLIDFLAITKECVFAIYEDLFNFSTIKYLY